MSRGEGGGRQKGIGKYELPLKPGTGLAPLAPNGGPTRRIDGLGRNARAWCYRCDAEHRWEEACLA